MKQLSIHVWGEDTSNLAHLVSKMPSIEDAILDGAVEGEFHGGAWEISDQ